MHLVTRDILRLIPLSVCTLNITSSQQNIHKWKIYYNFAGRFKFK